MWPNMFVPWPKLPGGLAAVWSWGWWGLRCLGTWQAGREPGLGTESPCATAAFQQHWEQAVIHRLPAR